MKQKYILFILIYLCGVMTVKGAKAGDYIWWNVGADKNVTDIYGEVEVLATTPGTYFCATGWRNGEPAGGYSGIQDNKPTERRAIFSVWDTSPTLHPEIIAVGPQVQTNRFASEGSGAHSHTIFPWKVGQTVRFYLRKRPGAAPNSTVTSYYYYDEGAHAWRGLSAIASPNGGFKSVASFSGGGLYSFIENFSGKQPDVPRVAVFRLWAGYGPEALRFVVHARGDGNWGQVSDGYFLAAGDVSQFQAIYAASGARHGQARLIKKGDAFAPLADQPLAIGVKNALKHLPNLKDAP